MTHGSGSDPGALPPPECPAHGAAARLYGAAVAEDPHGLYARLRTEEGPVVPVELEPGVEAWLVIGYQELLELTRDEATFSKDSRHWRALEDGTLRPDSRLVPMTRWRPSLQSMDGEEHQRLRRAVADTLGLIDRGQLRLTVERKAEELIGSWGAEGRADLLAQYARPLPLLVFTRLLGLPEAFGPRLIELITGIVDSNEDSVRSAKEFEDTLRALIAERHAEPGQDLPSWLLAHSAGLTDEEVLHHLVVVLVGGNETTINWTANTLRVVLTDPRFLSTLAGGRLTVSDALEEVLWRDPPTQNFPGRWATTDTVLGGREIRAGDMLVLGLAGANADPAVLETAAQSTLGNRAHLAWGAGPHACPAQNPARLIVETAVETLLRRLPDVELAIPAQELTWRPSPWSRALTALPVTFAPLAASAAPATTAEPGESATEGTSWTAQPPTPDAPTPDAPAPAGRAPSDSTPGDGTSTERTNGSAHSALRSWWNSLTGWRPGR